MNYNFKNEALKACEVSISYRPKIKPCDRPKLLSSMDIFRFLMENEVFNPDTIEYKEYFKVIFLNHSYRALGVLHLSEGGLDNVVVDIRHIMQAAILANSSMVVLVHNHPSGSIIPSREDNSITENVNKACKLFDILLIEHLIISSYSYYSYANEGQLTL